MNSLGILFELSPWSLLLFIALGTGLSYLLYSMQHYPWNKRTNIILACLRGLIITSIGLLIIGPFVRLTKNTNINPNIVLCLDNSSSIKHAMDSSQIDHLQSKISYIKETLSQKGYIVKTNSFNESSHFNYPNTNLSQLLKKGQKENKESFTLANILISDGIYNQGISPEYHASTFPIHCIGIGDTTVKKDIAIKSVQFNRLAYQGNKFPIRVNIKQKGFSQEQIKVQLIYQKRVIAKKEVSFNNEQEIQTLEFITQATKIGKQGYQVSIVPLAGEFNLENNHQNIYPEIIKGKKKILIAAAAPHPDIKFIKKSLEITDMYEIDLQFSVINKPLEDKKYDLIIFHQIPAKNEIRLNSLLNKKVNKLFIIGSNSNLKQVKTNFNSLSIQARNYKHDEVTAAINPNFNLFNLSDEQKETLEQSPPLSVPFGSYTAAPNLEVMCFQQVGSVLTQRPLIAFANKEKYKEGIIIGEGIWKWALNESLQKEGNHDISKLIAKVIQYLASTDNKKQFNVFPRKTEFDLADKIILEAEVYDDLYEKISGQDIALSIKSAEGAVNNYRFSTSSTNSSFQINGLKEGIYYYAAKTTIQKKEHLSKGVFSIQASNVESLNLQANHHLLQKIANQSGGLFVPLNNTDNLIDYILNQKLVKQIHSEESYVNLIDLKTLLALLITLLSIEWFIRRLQGSY